MSENLKLKKVNKSFVPAPISSIFGFLYAYEHYERFMHVNILVDLMDPLYILQEEMKKLSPIWSPWQEEI